MDIKKVLKQGKKKIIIVPKESDLNVGDYAVLNKISKIKTTVPYV